MNKFTSSIYKNYWCTWEKSEPKLQPMYADRALLILSIYSRSGSSIKDKFGKTDNSMEKTKLASSKPNIC